MQENRPKKTTPLAGAGPDAPETRRPHMSPAQRAKQFLPFAALAGLEEELALAEEPTVEWEPGPRER